MKPLHIFKAGKHVAASGDAFNFSESDVAATVAAYDPALHEAPIVVGHPRHDLPAYGWINALSFADGQLCAEPHQVDPEFAELVDKGRFKKISASFYAPDSPSNPVPGVYYLRHVGFLGAQPPAVKGLRNPEFNDSADDAIYIEFSEQSFSWSTLASIFRTLREYVIGKEGAEKADDLIPNWQIDQMQRAADELNATEAKKPAPAFNEPSPTPQPGASMKPEEIAAMQAENARLRAAADQVLQREAQLAAEEATASRKANVAFCEQLVTDGKLHPAQKENVAALLNILNGTPGKDGAAVVEFSEGDKKSQLSPANALKALLSAQPKIVEFAELGRQRGNQVDVDDPNAIARKAVEFQEQEQRAGRVISSAEAVRHVMGQ